MYKVYVIKSTKEDWRYIGVTSDLGARLKRHNQRRERSTKNKAPFELEHFWEFESKKEALRFEKYLKKSRNRKFLGKLINEGNKGS